MFCLMLRLDLWRSIIFFHLSSEPTLFQYCQKLSSGKSDDTQRLSVASETKATAGVSPYIFDVFLYIIYIHTFYMWAYVYNL